MENVKTEYIPEPTIYPDWLIVSSFNRMSDEQKSICAVRHEYLKEKGYKPKIAPEFVNILNSNTVIDENRCKVHNCVAGKILEGNTFIKYCDCAQGQEIETITKSSGFTESMLEKTVKSYKTEFDMQKEAKTNVINYLKDFNDTKKIDKGFMFMGQSGAGKTHLASAICSHFIKNGITTRLMSYAKDIYGLKFNQGDEGYNKILDSFLNPKVILIDDLFQGEPTKSEISIIWKIIDERIKHNKVTIVTTEKTFEELSDISGSLTGRLIEMSSPNIIDFTRDSTLNYRIQGAFA